MNRTRSGIGVLRGACLAAFAALMGWTIPAAGVTIGVHNLGLFQIDGDATASCGASFNPGGVGTVGCTGDDWDSLYVCTGAFLGDCTKNAAGDPTGTGTKTVSGAMNRAFVISDLVTDAPELSIFIGGGSKDEADLNQWH